MTDTAVRVTRLEVTGLSKESKDRWKTMCQRMQEFENMLWQEWLVWHVTNGSRAKIDEYLAAMREWHEAKKSGVKGLKKPKLELFAVNKELSKILYDAGVAQFGDLGSRVRVLQMQIWKGTVTSRKASNGSLSGWMSILMNREAIPSFTRPCPIPFDKVNCKIIPPEKGGNFKVELRLSRVQEAILHESEQDAGRTSAKKARAKPCPSIVDTVELWTKGRKRQSQSKILWRCVGEKYKFCGSKVVFDRGKVYVMLCYKMPIEHAALDHSKTAFLRPAKSHPWKLRTARNRWPGGLGHPVEAIRRQSILQRRGRQHGYRSASSSRKGHGRTKAIAPLGAYSRKWREFCKRFNHNTMNDVVRQCVEAGYGKLVYFQPTEGGNLFLSTAGKVDGVNENSAWEWFQVKTLLEQKCMKAGIELVVRKSRRVPLKNAA